MNRVVRAQKVKLALVAESGLQVGQSFPLLEQRQVIGRREDASIPVDDSKVSRDHALVDYRNGLYYLVDLGSTNGSFVNGRKVQHAMRINLGDVLRFGGSSFKVSIGKPKADSLIKPWSEPTRASLLPRPEDASEGASDSVSQSALSEKASSDEPSGLSIIKEPEVKKSFSSVSLEGPSPISLKGQLIKNRAFLLLLVLGSLLIVGALFTRFDNVFIL